VSDGGLPRRQAQRVGSHLELQVGVLAAGCGNDGLQLGLLGSQLVKVGIGLGIGRIDLVEPLLRGGGRRCGDRRSLSRLNGARPSCGFRKITMSL
jgi:hypothetical protein